jgi:serine/threonine protein kinase
VSVDFSQEQIRGKTGIDEWSAPETRKWADYDEKCDMWSVGCLIRYLITGSHLLPDQSSAEITKGL